MMKLAKILLLFFCLLGQQTTKAQKMYQWELFPSYHNALKTVCSKEKVYALCNGNLLSYKTADQEVYRYDKTNLLNGFKISFIKYNKTVDKLIIVYADGNIDLMTDNETVVNIPQYKNKLINNKEIYGVNITDKYAYLATGFGIVVLDMQQNIIENTYILDFKVNATAIYNNKVYAATERGIYFAELDKNLMDKKSWQNLSGHYFTELMVFDNILFGNNTRASLFVLNEKNKTFDATDFKLINAWQITDGMMMAANSQNIYIFKNANEWNTIKQNNALQDIDYKNGVFWGASGYEGLKPYRINSDNQMEAVGEAIIPNSPVRDYANFINFAGNRLLVVGGNLNYNGVNYEGTVMYYDDNKWTNFQDGQAISDKTGLPYINTVNIAQDPRDENHHFVTSARLGMYEFLNGEMVRHYTCDNSRINSILPFDVERKKYVSTSGAMYDNQNNMWFINNQVDTIINVIKADGSWVKIYDEKIKGYPTFDFIMMDRKGRVWLNSRRHSQGIYMLDFNGTIEDTSDDESYFRASITNQDGKTYAPFGFYCMTEDQNGEIWIGTDVGLFVISNPDEFKNNNFVYTQIKVPRNDGTNYADYLLNNTNVTCIAVDGANRKWIGTTNGVYLVSADGMETIHHFTMENSPLISNSINSIAINHDNGQVMIATDKGLVAYNNDAAKPQESMEKSNVKAYPNPVKPEYNGYITIKGLTQNSCVKITSSNGQLIHEGVSNGGIYTWNGRNKQGKRVASGAYSVMATTENGKESVVTKIIIIR